MSISKYILRANFLGQLMESEKLETSFMHTNDLLLILQLVN